MSDRGHIEVAAFSVERRFAEPVFGGGRWCGVYGPTPQRVRLELAMDDAGLERFIEMMEEICPGCSRGRRRDPEAMALSATQRTFPSGPLEGEFVDV